MVGEELRQQEDSTAVSAQDEDLQDSIQSRPQQEPHAEQTMDEVFDPYGELIGRLP